MFRRTPPSMLSVRTVQRCLERRLTGKDKARAGVIMKIDCYLSPECGSEEGLRENIAKASAIENIEVEINFHRIDDDTAAALRLSGSPSVFVNGKELQPQGSIGFS